MTNRPKLGPKYLVTASNGLVDQWLGAGPHTTQAPETAHAPRAAGGTATCTVRSIPNYPEKGDTAAPVVVRGQETSQQNECKEQKHKGTRSRS
jgi:hypothetical protein